MPNEKQKPSGEEADLESAEVEQRSSPGGHIVYKAVKKEGEDELERSIGPLFRRREL